MGLQGYISPAAYFLREASLRQQPPSMNKTPAMLSLQFESFGRAQAN